MSPVPVPAMRHVDWLQRYAMTRPQQLAVSDPELTLTYGQLYQAIHLLAHRFAESGVTRGQTVGVCLNGQTLAVVVFATLNMMGCVPVTIDRPKGIDGNIELPRHFSIDAVLVEPPFRGGEGSGAITIDRAWLQGTREQFREWTGPSFTDSDEIVHIFNSSGTTGTPKYMGMTSRQLDLRFIRRNLGILVPLTGGPSLSRMGMRIYGGFVSAFSILWTGGTAYLAWPSQDIPALIERQRIKNILAAPVQHQAVLEHLGGRRFDLSSLKGLICGGSSVPAKLLDALKRNLCPTVVDIYGSTEAGGVAMGLANGSGEVGYLYPWVQAQAVDEDDKPLLPGTEGILRFRSDEMITEYVNDEEATAEYFRDGWFYPGDVGAISEQRFLRLSGRTSERMNAGGVKLAPGPIEDIVRSFDGVTDCAVFEAPDAMGINKIWAAVVVRHNTNLDALSKYCRDKLGFKAPHNYLRLAELPRNAMGKVVRGDLRNLAAASSRPAQNISSA